MSSEGSDTINGRKRVVMPGFRKVTEEDDVIPNEKRKTRGVSEFILFLDGS
jgi:hypothetical protein